MVPVFIEIEKLILTLKNIHYCIFYSQLPQNPHIKSTLCFQNAFEPTFGQKWEINRDTLKIDKVLGRGNYGIVCLGYLATEQLDENGEYERIIQNTSNAESSSNGNSETFLMGRENYKAVAVKRLQGALMFIELGLVTSLCNKSNLKFMFHA